MSLAPGTKLGPYEVLSAIGAGGMGEVYKARDTRLDRIVAIKVLPPEVAGDAQFRERFEREGRTISRLNHPHICTLHDIGEQDGISFLVLEFIEGETLSARLERGALPLGQALKLATEVCDALDKAHALGVIHRDLKPANVMLTKGGAKLLDFGLARNSEGLTGHARSSGEPPPTLPMGLTAEGMILGTLPYMSPEQVEGREVDARSDVWAFGCLLYEMVTGTPPFTGKSAASLMAAILEHPPASLSERVPAVPADLERLIRTCLEKDPGDRWQSARDLLHELRWMASTPSGIALASHGKPRASGFFALGAAGLAVFALAAGWAMGRNRAVAAPPRRTGPPVIVLMDSTHPQRVYDDETRKAGGTNADDLTDLLRDLPVALVKENTNVQWHREFQVLQENPDLIVLHRSCFFDATYFPDPQLSEQTYPFAADKFELFLGLVGTSNPRTRFLVYSRKSWKDDAAKAKWVSDLEKRFPVLQGRVRAWPVPLDRISFRHPATGAEIKAQVREMLPKH